MDMTQEFDLGPRPEEERLGQETIKHLRGWNQFEKNQEDGLYAIDFDMVDRDFGATSFSSRNEVSQALSSLKRNVIPTTPFTFFLDGLLTSIPEYIRATEEGIGDFNTHTEKMFGFRPEIVPEDEIREQRERADASLVNLGLSPNPEAYKKFYNEETISPEEVVRQIDDATAKHLPVVAEALNLQHLLPLQYRHENITTDAFFTVHVGTDDNHDVIFEVNTGPRAVWTRGNPEEKSVHENIAHVLQAVSWKDNVEKGLINPSYGVTAFASPAQWTSEGMAVYLARLIPDVYDNFTPEGKASFEIYHLGQLVNNNIVLMANEGRQVDEILAYALERAPHKTDRDVRDLLEDSTHPIFGPYQLTYPDAGRFMIKKSQELGQQKTIELLKEMYRIPMTPNQARTYANKLKNS